MNDTDGLIPTFNNGDRVIVKVQCIEAFCPECGEAYGTHSAGKVFTGTITDHPGSEYCGNCHADISRATGWYGVKIDSEWDGHRYFSVPYTLLEKV